MAITATTLLNGTLGELLSHIDPAATVMLLGPSTPYAPSLFECGIDVLAGVLVTHPPALLQAVGEGRCFRELPGIESVAWMRS